MSGGARQARVGPHSYFFQCHKMRARADTTDLLEADTHISDTTDLLEATLQTCCRLTLQTCWRPTPKTCWRQTLQTCWRQILQTCWRLTLQTYWRLTVTVHHRPAGGYTTDLLGSRCRQTLQACPSSLSSGKGCCPRISWLQGKNQVKVVQMTGTWSGRLPGAGVTPGLLETSWTGDTGGTPAPWDLARDSAWSALPPGHRPPPAGTAAPPCTTRAACPPGESSVRTWKQIPLLPIGSLFRDPGPNTDLFANIGPYWVFISFKKSLFLPFCNFECKKDQIT